MSASRSLPRRPASHLGPEPAFPLPSVPSGAARLPSHGVSPPSALEASRVHFTRVYLARYVPLAGFLTLLGGSSSPCPPALFHAGSAPGVLPPGLCLRTDMESLSGLVTLLTLVARACRGLKTGPRSAPRACLFRGWTLWLPRLQGLAPRLKPSFPLAVLPAYGWACPHGLSLPSRVFPLSATRPPSRPLLSCPSSCFASGNDVNHRQ